MNKLICSLAILLIPGLCFAGELATAEQTVTNDQTYFTSNVSKMPENQNGKHKITNHFTFFTSNVVVNGKTQIIIPTKEQLEELKAILGDRI